jgi:tungstate transport system ATP-binding protein
MTGMRDRPSILPLAADGLRFETGGKRLIDGIDLAVGRGECLALLGPNGSGKTLTLRLLHGLDRPTAGTVRWAPGSDTVSGRKRHAMVFQKPVMLRRSAVANVRHALAAASYPRAEIADRADAALARFGLQDLAARPARVLSGGEQQRLAIARAAALEPDILFMDEPTAALDPGASRQIEAMFGELKRDGIALVFSTHDIGQARRVADRVAIFGKGRIVEQGPAEPTLASPETEEARAFVAGDLPW